MPTPLPSKGTVLQTAEFADSLYSPLFVSVLYHILIHLSRGFFRFFSVGYRSDFGDKLGWVYDLRTTNQTRFCILRKSHIVSAWGLWFTFVFRTQEHRAVGSSVTRSYSLSWAPVWCPLPCPRLLYPYCIILLRVCQEVF